MPKNRFIYIGVLVVAAVALIYLANEFTKFVMPVLPYVGALGAILIIAGVFIEANKSKGAMRLARDLKPGEAEAESITETKIKT